MYHGTRNILLGNRFDLRYVGSGEGNQSFGYGIYLGQAKGTGESYRTAGMDYAENTIFIDKDGHKFNHHGLLLRFWDVKDKLPPSLRKHFSPDAMVDVVITKAVRFKRGLSNALNDVVYALNYYVPLKADEEKLVRELIEPIMPISMEQKKHGNLYLVDGPEDFELLDWDAEMPKQSEQVLEKLKRAELYLDDEETGANLYWRLVDKFDDVDVYEAKRLASMALNDAGIVGHRYFDGDSRDKGEGTHNFCHLEY